MPDLDSELAVLREDLRASVRQPELGTVIERARQRKARRRRQFGTVAAVLVVAAAIPLLRTQFQQVPDNGITPGGTKTITPTSYLSDVQFTDERTGYALRGTCEPGSSMTRCTGSFLVTEDGEHWQRRNFPPGDRSFTNGQIFVLGHDRVVVHVYQMRSFERWYTADGGRTWRQVPLELQGSVAEIPKDAILEYDCTPSGTECVASSDRLWVVQPDTGRVATLATALPLKQPYPTSYPMPDGSWWISGKDPATGQWKLAVSRDGGRSWSVSPLPPFEGMPSAGLVVVAGPNALYATATWQRDPFNFLLAIFSSSDGGRTWTRAWQSGDHREPETSRGLVVATDGSLVVSTDSGVLYRSTDGGRGFTKDDSVSGFVQQTRSGYILLPNLRTTTTFHRSLDGTQWTERTIG